MTIDNTEDEKISNRIKELLIDELKKNKGDLIIIDEKLVKDTYKKYKKKLSPTNFVMYELKADNYIITDLKLIDNKININFYSNKSKANIKFSEIPEDRLDEAISLYIAFFRKNNGYDINFRHFLKLKKICLSNNDDKKRILVINIKEIKFKKKKQLDKHIIERLESDLNNEIMK